MTNRLYIDFETRSAADLSKVGSWNYAKHSTTDVLHLAYAINDGPVRLLKHHDNKPIISRYYVPRDFEQAIIDCYEIWAHNVSFERHIYNHILHARYGWPKIDDSLWRCSMSLCDRWGVPGALENAAEFLRLPHKKDKIGKALMLKMSRPRRLKKSTELKWFEDPKDLKRLGEYCCQDVATERAIATKLPPLEPEELAIWHWTEKLNDYGILTDQELVTSILAVIAELDARDLAEFRELTQGDLESPRQTAALKDWLADSAGLEIDNLQAATIRDVLQLEDLSLRARQALEARKNLSKSSLAKFTALRDKSDLGDHRIRGHLRYCGAHTGRWSGKGIQTQNLPAAAASKYSSMEIEQAVDVFKTRDLAFCESMLSNVRDLASLSVRSALTAPPGKAFLAADFAAIEARGLLWLSSAEQLDILRTGGNLYVAMAERIYKRKVVKGVDKAEYDMGKRAILGLGYGMGAKKFRATCAKYGAKITEEFAQQTVDAYRQWITAVPQFWYTLERTFFRALETGRAEIDKLRVEYKQKTLRCYLPSGRALVYWYPRILDTMTSWGEARPQIHYVQQGKSLISTYGGKLAENVTQAMCRDLLRDAVLRVQREHPDFRQVLTVHDEVVYEADEANLEDVIKTLCVTPDWATGMPIAAEGWVGPRYKK